MIDGHVHLEKGEYCVEWVNQFVDYALDKGIEEIYFLEHTHNLNEYTSVDFEMGYIKSFKEIMEMETAMLKYTLNYLAEYYKKEIALLNLTLPMVETIPAIRFREAKMKIAEAYNRPVNIPLFSVITL